MIVELYLIINDDFLLRLNAARKVLFKLLEELGGGVNREKPQLGIPISSCPSQGRRESSLHQSIGCTIENYLYVEGYHMLY